MPAFTILRHHLLSHASIDYLHLSSEYHLISAAWCASQGRVCMSSMAREDMLMLTEHSRVWGALVS